MKTSKLLILAIFTLVTFCFVSFSVTAAHHIFLIVALICALFRKENVRLFPQSMSQKMLWLFVLVSILSIFLNPIENRMFNLLKLKYFVITLLCIGVIYENRKDVFTKKLVRLYINILCVTTAIATISGIVAMWTGFHYLRNRPSCHLDRVCGMYGMYMTYAYGIQFILVLLAGMLIYYKKFREYLDLKFVIPAFAINFIGLYMAYTRGALVGFLLAIPFFFIRKNAKVFLFTTFIILAVAAPTIYFVPRLNDAFLHRPGSNDQRLSLFQAAIAGFKESPIYGLGYKNFEPQSRRLKYTHQIFQQHVSGHAHNNFLEALASTGALGFLAFSLFLIFWLKESWLLPAGLGDISISFIAAFFVSGMVQYTFGDGENLFVILFIYILSQVSWRQSRE